MPNTTRLNLDFLTPIIYLESIRKEVQGIEIRNKPRSDQALLQVVQGKMTEEVLEGVLKARLKEWLRLQLEFLTSDSENKYIPVSWIWKTELDWVIRSQIWPRIEGSLKQLEDFLFPSDKSEPKEIWYPLFELIYTDDGEKGRAVTTPALLVVQAILYSHQEWTRPFYHDTWSAGQAQADLKCRGIPEGFIKKVAVIISFLNLFRNGLVSLKEVGIWDNNEEAKFINDSPLRVGDALAREIFRLWKATEGASSELSEEDKKKALCAVAACALSHEKRHPPQGAAVQSSLQQKYESFQNLYKHLEEKNWSPSERAVLCGFEFANYLISTFKEEDKIFKKIVDQELRKFSLDPNQTSMLIFSLGRFWSNQEISNYFSDPIQVNLNFKEETKDQLQNLQEALCDLEKKTKFAHLDFDDTAKKQQRLELFFKEKKPFPIDENIWKQIGYTIKWASSFRPWRYEGNPYLPIGIVDHAFRVLEKLWPEKFIIGRITWHETPLVRSNVDHGCTIVLPRDNTLSAEAIKNGFEAIQLLENKLEQLKSTLEECKEKIGGGNITEGELHPVKKSLEEKIAKIQNYISNDNDIALKSGKTKCIYDNVIEPIRKLVKKLDEFSKSILNCNCENNCEELKALLKEKKWIDNFTRDIMESVYSDPKMIIARYVAVTILNQRMAYGSGLLTLTFDTEEKVARIWQEIICWIEEKNKHETLRYYLDQISSPFYARLAITPITKIKLPNDINQLQALCVDIGATDVKVELRHVDIKQLINSNRDSEQDIQYILGSEPIGEHRYHTALEEGQRYANGKHFAQRFRKEITKNLTSFRADCLIFIGVSWPGPVMGKAGIEYVAGTSGILNYFQETTNRILKNTLRDIHSLKIKEGFEEVFRSESHTVIVHLINDGEAHTRASFALLQEEEREQQKGRNQKKQDNCTVTLTAGTGTALGLISRGMFTPESILAEVGKFVINLRAPFPDENEDFPKGVANKMFSKQTTPTIAEDILRGKSPVEIRKRF